MGISQQSPCKNRGRGHAAGGAHDGATARGHGPETQQRTTKRWLIVEDYSNIGGLLHIYIHINIYIYTY